MGMNWKNVVVRHGVRLVFFGVALLLRKFVGFEVTVLLFLATIYGDQK